MTKLKPGDLVSCCVKQLTIVSPYNDHDEVKIFEIISDDTYGYYLYVPSYICINNTVKADANKCKQLNINLKFLDTDMVYINQSMIFKVNVILNGMPCIKCKEFYSWAEPNQDNGTLICWQCRNYPHYS
jgi:hypothetical protein